MFFANKYLVFINSIYLYIVIIKKGERQRKREGDRGGITFILFITAVELNFTQMTVGTLGAT